MWQDNPNLVRRLILLGIAVLILLASLIFYASRGNQYAPSEALASYQPPLTNAAVLKSWLPETSYQYVLARVSDYLRASGHTVSAMTIADGINISNGSYDFHLTFLPQQLTIPVIVTVANFGGIISTAVTINGQLQTPQVNQQGQTNIGGIDTLINMGTTSSQLRSLRSALSAFAPNAKTISISSTHARHSLDQTTNTNTYSFSVKIDDKTYSANLVCPDLTSAQLILNDTQTNKQVLNSGIISSAE